MSIYLRDKNDKPREEKIIRVTAIAAVALYISIYLPVVFFSFRLISNTPINMFCDLLFDKDVTYSIVDFYYSVLGQAAFVVQLICTSAYITMYGFSNKKIDIIAGLNCIFIPIELLVFSVSMDELSF